MSTAVRLARALLLLVIATLTVSFIIGVASSGTGTLEKVVLLILIGGCFVLAAKVSTLAHEVQERLQRRSAGPR